MKKYSVLFHGDCDGVISAGLYIRRFLRDLYPSQTILRHSHPWRLKLDLKKILSHSEVGTVILIDLALSDEEIDAIAKAIKKGISFIVIDHHQSSEKAIEKLKNLDNVKIFWITVQSTPQVLAQLVVKNLNNYEQLLVNVANVCEGGSVDDEYVKTTADKVKLVLAIEPTNNTIIYNSISGIVRGEEFWKISCFDDIYRKAKWLLNLLLKKMQNKIKTVCGWDIAVFTLPESLIFAGLFGIASSEYMKKIKKSIILIREEEDKLVVTIRSVEKKALDVCNSLTSYINNKSKGVYGGHKEAASITVKKSYTLNEIEKIVEDVVKKYACV